MYSLTYKYLHIPAVFQRCSFYAHDEKSPSQLELIYCRIPVARVATEQTWH